MESKQYGDIDVSAVDVENFADFKIRTFILSRVRTSILPAFMLQTIQPNFDFSAQKE